MSIDTISGHVIVPLRTRDGIKEFVISPASPDFPSGTVMLSMGNERVVLPLAMLKQAIEMYEESGTV